MLVGAGKGFVVNSISSLVASYIGLSSTKSYIVWLRGAMSHENEFSNWYVLCLLNSPYVS